MEKVPQVMKMDPKEIPLQGCKPATNMKIKYSLVTDGQNHSGDMVVYFVNGMKTDEKIMDAKWQLPKEMIPQEYHQILQDAIDNKAFKATAGSNVCVYTPKGSSCKQVCLMGMGPLEEFELKISGKIATTLAKILIECKSVKDCGLVFPSSHCDVKRPCDEKTECPYMKAKHMTSESIFQTFLQTLLVELSPDLRFKGKEDKSKIPSVESLCIYGRCGSETCEETIKKARVFAEGIYFARELVNAPANYCNTIALANAAVKMAQENGLKAKVLKLEEIEELKMGSYLAVSKGAFYPPRFIHLTYTGEGDIKKKMAYVGKGVCFDSGGYNIKSAASSIELMKMDMGGAAACLGAALAISKIKPKNVEIHFIIPAGENMVDKAAYRPGDIITASNGKTIEVGNTDAEGRLMLADALVYADRLGVDLIVDLATLTGACVVALGNDIAGLFSDTDFIAEKILYVSKKAGENMWRLPCESSYRPLMDSTLADINNVGGKGKGGAILAAMFLKEFVENSKWAHIDIAGPAWDNTNELATGYGVKTLTQLAIEASECHECCK